VGAQPSLERSKGRSLTVQAVRDPGQRLCVFAEAIDDIFVGSGQLLLHVGEVLKRSDEGDVSPVETLQRRCNGIRGGAGAPINIGFEVAKVSLRSVLKGGMTCIQGFLQS